MKKPVPVLRDYQHAAIEGVRERFRAGDKRVVLQMPTGAGKSVTIAYLIARAAEKGMSAWLLCHRTELLDQLSGTLWQAGVTHGQIMADRMQTRESVQVASVQTLVRRLDKLRPPDLLAIDECHHAKAATYEKIIAACGTSKMVGLTATPVRTDGQGLGDIFQSLVCGPTVGELTARGYLAPYRIIPPPKAVDVTGVHMVGGDYNRDELEVVVDQGAIIGDAVEHYRKYVYPRTCLVYCVSRKHARHVTEIYRAAGIAARYVGGDTLKAEREATIRGFRKGVPPVIVSVDLFGEGLDVPGLSAVQLLRPTASLGLHLQQIGRALRPEAGKEYAVILDHVGNSWKHGLPDDERTWSLEGRKKRKGEQEYVPPIKQCPACFSIFRPAPKCPYCGHVCEVKSRIPDQAEGQLQEITPDEHRALRGGEQKPKKPQTPEQRRRAIERSKARSLEEFVQIALKNGHKPGWGARQWLYRTEGRFDGPELVALKVEAQQIADRLTREQRRTA